MMNASVKNDAGSIAPVAPDPKYLTAASAMNPAQMSAMMTSDTLKTAETEVLYSTDAS